VASADGFSAERLCWFLHLHGIGEVSRRKTRPRKLPLNDMYRADRGNNADILSICSAPGLLELLGNWRTARLTVGAEADCMQHAVAAPRPNVVARPRLEGICAHQEKARLVDHINHRHRSPHPTSNLPPSERHSQKEQRRANPTDETKNRAHLHESDEEQKHRESTARGSEPRWIVGTTRAAALVTVRVRAPRLH
jgi:hypothetical protein